MASRALTARFSNAFSSRFVFHVADRLVEWSLNISVSICEAERDARVKCVLRLLADGRLSEEEAIVRQLRLQQRARRSA